MVPFHDQKAGKARKYDIDSCIIANQTLELQLNYEKSDKLPWTPYLPAKMPLSPANKEKIPG